MYRAQFEPGEKRGVIVASFPDVPEAITEGRSETHAMTQAQEALGLALLTYPARNLPLPKPKARERESRADCGGGSCCGKARVSRCIPRSGDRQV